MAMVSVREIVDAFQRLPILSSQVLITRIVEFMV